MTTTTYDNIDPAELAKFDSLASRWWDLEGEFRSLHEINPLRLDWIRQHAKLDGSKVVDIGCGGGILAESMAAANANVTGIDMVLPPLYFDLDDDDKVRLVFEETETATV